MNFNNNNLIEFENEQPLMIKEYIEGSIANFNNAEKSESEVPLIVK